MIAVPVLMPFNAPVALLTTILAALLLLQVPPGVALLSIGIDMVCPIHTTGIPVLAGNVPTVTMVVCTQLLAAV